MDFTVICTALEAVKRCYACHLHGHIAKDCQGKLAAVTACKAALVPRARTDTNPAGIKQAVEVSSEEGAAVDLPKGTQADG